MDVYQYIEKYIRILGDPVYMSVDLLLIYYTLAKFYMEIRLKQINLYPYIQV